jgi:hypothetical protein
MRIGTSIANQNIIEVQLSEAIFPDTRESLPLVPRELSEGLRHDNIPYSPENEKLFLQFLRLNPNIGATQMNYVVYLLNAPHIITADQRNKLNIDFDTGIPRFNSSIIRFN